MHFLLIRFHHHENLGIVPEILVENGLRWTTVDGDGVLPHDISHIDAVIIYGGVQNVWQEDKYPWLPALKRYLADIIAAHSIPVLGICLGHQLIAEAAGGACHKMPKDEIGMHPVTALPAAADDPLLKDFISGTAVLQWHGAEVCKLPEQATLLAQNDTCDVQAMRVGSRVWGLQFHIEGTLTTVPTWGSTKVAVDEMEQNMGEDGYWIFRNSSLELMPAQMIEARKIFQNFIDIAEEIKMDNAVTKIAAQS